VVIHRRARGRVRGLGVATVARVGIAGIRDARALIGTNVGLTLPSIYADRVLTNSWTTHVLALPADVLGFTPVSVGTTGRNATNKIETLRIAVALDTVAGAITEASIVVIALGVQLCVGAPLALAVGRVAFAVHGAVVAIVAVLQSTGIIAA
jgi:hypothetical protein